MQLMDSFLIDINPQLYIPHLAIYIELGYVYLVLIFLS
jgi:hypothetical protein